MHPIIADKVARHGWTLTYLIRSEGMPRSILGQKTRGLMTEQVVRLDRKLKHA